MTKSKFDVFYIVRSIVVTPVIFFVLLVALAKVFYLLNVSLINTLIIELIFLSIAAFFLNYLVFHRLVKITVTEDYVMFKNLITREIVQIYFDELENVTYAGEGLASNVYVGKMNSTHTRYVCLKLKSGEEWWFNDSKYSNFDEINKAIIIILTNKQTHENKM